jgi:hypothetical protein
MDEANRIAEAAEQEFLSGFSSYMDDIDGIMAEKIEIIYHDWSEGLGGIFDSLDEAMEVYDQKDSVNKFFMVDEDKIFELNKLTREITKSLEDMTDPAMIEKYTAMLENLNVEKENGLQITESEMDIIKAQFELEKLKD